MADKKIPIKYNKINKRCDLSAEFVRSILDYNPETGIFTWKYRESCTPSRKRRFAGKSAGYITNGYRRIKINSILYSGHRLAWLYHYGQWPDDEIDHINLDRADNRIENLRQASITENNRNRPISKANSSGYKGASYIKSRPGKNKFLSAIVVNKKTISLGWFETVEEAHRAYCKACKKYHGDFSRIE